jgi:hypothetical protein
MAEDTPPVAASGTASKGHPRGRAGPPGCIRAIVGLLLVFFIHVPRLVYLALLASYAYVFSRQENLTADPREHLKRATKLLKSDNSWLLYAALEVRFALERMAQRELLFAEKATRTSLQEPDPIKKLKALRKLDPNAAFRHRFVLVMGCTGDRFPMEHYYPLDLERVGRIHGRLGDLLHPKVGLSLGITTDPWYLQTRAFLVESIDYLTEVLKDNTPFFTYEGVESMKMVLCDELGEADAHVAGDRSVLGGARVTTGHHDIGSRGSHTGKA